MEYNTQRPKLLISEYGRNIQKMVDFACTVKDKEERTKVAQAIVQVMAQLHPGQKDVGDLQHKLWDHLILISEHKLDVDSPYPKPEESIEKDLVKLAYPTGKIKIRHYGRTVELLIDAAKEMSDGDEKSTLVGIIANLMKRNYLNWNRDSVNDRMIFDNLTELSGGELKVKDGLELHATRDIIASTKKPSRKSRNKGHKSRRKR